LSRISDDSWKQIYDKTVEIKSAETHWPVYEAYKLDGMEDSRYIRKPKYNGSALNKIVKSIDPFTPEYAGLFLEFARWFDKHKMDKGTKDEFGCGPNLDTTRNAQATLAWVHKYGVLGLGRNPCESFAVVGRISSSSTEIAAEQLGRPGLGHPGPRAYSKGREGGKHETVEGFVFEAYHANVVLKLYEAATAPTVDVPSIARFMLKRRDIAFHLPSEYARFVPSEREQYSEDANDARFWALAVVEDAVNTKVENDTYPIVVGEPYSYKAGWGFKSLLGAMWLQMRGFMLGETSHCLYCGGIFPKTRRNKVYCGDVCGGRARADRQYARKKQREQEVSAARRRRLRR
jgi:hypothetical protein